MLAADRAMDSYWQETSELRHWSSLLQGDVLGRLLPEFAFKFAFPIYDSSVKIAFERSLADDLEGDDH